MKIIKANEQSEVTGLWHNSILWQWFSTRTYLMVFTVLFLPLFLVGSCNSSPSQMFGSTFGAKRGAEYHPVLAGMTQDQRQEYGETLSELLIDEVELFTSLIGDDVHLVLSQPSLERKDGASMVWQYRSESCVLDVFFAVGNPSVQSLSAPVEHFEMRTRRKAEAFGGARVFEEPDGVDNVTCLNSIIAMKDDHQGDPAVSQDIAQMDKKDMIVADAR